MNKIRLHRNAVVPDPIRIQRCRRAPDLGPKILFFSGGSALKSLSRRLVDYTHNSIHLITPFDSGGSSARIRETFDMLSVGDLRNRIMALADQSIQGNPKVYELFACRFPDDGDNWELYKRLDAMAKNRDPLVAAIPNPMRRIIRNHLHHFLENMPGGFDLRGASIGNLILAAGYLNNRRHIEPVVYMFTKMVEARGIVRPITGLSYHLAARLADDTVVAGQHRITGKEVRPIQSRIEQFFLTKSLSSAEPARLIVKDKIHKLIAGADIICYPFGSYYTSIIANLLPSGVGEAISRADVPKIYIPNRGKDPEQYGHTLSGLVETLLRYLRASCLEENVPTERLLNFVLLDTRLEGQSAPDEIKAVEDMGICVIDTPLSPDGASLVFDDDMVIQTLCSLV
jgi:CofD-related protein of GAK system